MCEGGGGGDKGVRMLVGDRCFSRRLISQQNGACKHLKPSLLLSSHGLVTAPFGPSCTCVMALTRQARFDHRQFEDWTLLGMLFALAEGLRSRGSVTCRLIPPSLPQQDLFSLLENFPKINNSNIIGNL